jgi:hypothetical protein
MQLMSVTACGTADGTYSATQSVRTRSTFRDKRCAISFCAARSSPAMSAFQNPGVLDISRRLPAGLGQLMDTDAAHGPIREDPELPLQRRSGADCQQAVKSAWAVNRT